LIFFHMCRERKRSLLFHSLM